jgi:hypothetical protein
MSTVSTYDSNDLFQLNITTNGITPDAVHGGTNFDMTADGLYIQVAADLFKLGITADGSYLHMGLFENQKFIVNRSILLKSFN